MPIKRIEIRKLKDRIPYKGHLKQLHENSKNCRGDLRDYQIILTANGKDLLTLECTRALQIGNEYYWMPENDAAYAQYADYLLHGKCPTADDLFIWRADTTDLRVTGTGVYKDGIKTAQKKPVLNPKSDNFDYDVIAELYMMTEIPPWARVFLDPDADKLQRAYGLSKKLDRDNFVPCILKN